MIDTQANVEIASLLAQRLRSDAKGENLGLLDLLANIVKDNLKTNNFERLQNILTDVIQFLVFDLQKGDKSAMSSRHDNVVNVVLSYPELNLVSSLLEVLLEELARFICAASAKVDRLDDDDLALPQKSFELLQSYGYSNLLNTRAEKTTGRHYSEIDDMMDIDSVVASKENVLNLLKFCHLLFFRLDENGSTKSQQDKTIQLIRMDGQKILTFIMLLSTVLNEQVSQEALRIVRQTSSVLIKCSKLPSSKQSLATSVEDETRDFTRIIDSLYWQQICILFDISQSQEAAKHKETAFILWLGWMSLHVHYQPVMMDLLKRESYWAHLQSGLRHGSSERRKVCLYILLRSITIIDQPITNGLFTWNSSKQRETMEFWKKYITLCELVSLDNSLFQVKEATKDFASLFEKATYLKVPSSWLSTMLAVGFYSKANGIARTLCETILELPSHSMGWLQEEIRSSVNTASFFIETFLPFAIKSPNFIVRQISSKDVCEYGTKLAKFISQLFRQGWGQGFSSILSTVILSFASDSTGFAQLTGKFFVLNGMIQGIEGQTILDYSHAALIGKISRLRCITPPQKELNGLICFRLLRHIGFEPEAQSQSKYLILLLNILEETGALLSRKEAEAFGIFLNDDDIVHKLLYNGLSSFMDDISGKEQSKKERLMALLVAISLTRQGNLFEDVRRLIQKDATPDKPLPCAKSYLEFLAALTKFEESYKRELFQIPEIRQISWKVIRIVSKESDSHSDRQCLVEIIRCFPSAGQDLSEQSHVLRRLFVNTWRELEATPFESLTWKDEGSQSFERLYSNLCICTASSTALDHEVAFTDGDLSLLIAGIVILQKKCIPKKVPHMKVFHKILEQAFLLLQCCLQSRGILSEKLGISCLQAFRLSLPSVDNAGLSRLLDCLLMVLEFCPTSLNSMSDLGEFLIEISRTAEENKTVAEKNGVYTKCIEAVFHPTIFDASVSIGYAITEICKNIQRYALSRRCLGPALAKALCRAFDATPDSFCREHTLTDVIIEFMLPSNPPSSHPDFYLESPLTDMLDEIKGITGSYEQYYGEHEKFAQLRIFDLLTRFDFDDAIQEMFAKTVFDEIFEEWTKIQKEDQFKVIHKWKRTAQLQAALLLERFMTEDDCEDYMETLLIALTKEGVPRFRYMLEWLATLCILKFPHLRDVIWSPINQQENEVPAYIVSLMRIGLMVARSIDNPKVKKEYFDKLVCKAIPFATSSRVTIRHAGAVLIPILFEDASKLGYTDLTSNSLFQELNQFVLDTPYRKNAGSAQEEIFDPVGNHSLLGVLGGSYLVDVEGGEMMQLFCENDFKYLKLQDKKRYVPTLRGGEQLPKINRILISNGTNGDGDVEMVDNNNNTRTSKENATPIPLQTKGGDWDVSKMLDRDNGYVGRLATRRQHHDIIVIASLVDNHFNLGGISRVCELSGVSELYFNLPKTALSSKNFTSVSLSSELWIPIKELREADIGNFLEGKRLEGYTIAGIEQTDRSIILGSSEFKFPKKTVLLIGRESLGVPAELLAAMDICLEIKQFGETRSMNVQTATAVVLYEYVRQNCEL